jgi:YihY family inner membrane protein
VVVRYFAAAGGLLANGLAYAALFAIVPGILLVVSVAGLVINDATRRADVVAFIAQVVPPLHDVVDAVLTQATTTAATLGVIGLVTLAWGASRFVLAFDEAIARVMGRTSRRSFLRRNAAAVGAVLVLVVAMIVAPALAGVASFVDVAEATGAMAVVAGALHIALGLVPPIITVIAIAFVYHAVPVPGPSWRAAVVPGVVIGIVLTVLVQAFVYLAPRLIGAAALLGTIAAVFAALAWLSLSFQALLLGAAWTAEREARPELSPGPQPPPGPDPVA